VVTICLKWTNRELQIDLSGGTRHHIRGHVASVLLCSL
jgi:hypothetical protein